MSEQLFDELGYGLDEAVARGDLPNPAEKPEDTSKRNDTDSKSYIWALRSRLVELGYLGESAKNRSSSGTDQAFTNAVKRFQRDVGEEQDRWAGPVTWRVLQCLVSFEDEQEPRHWKLKVPFQESPAVARAAWLRLRVMGFFVKNRNSAKDDWKNSKLKFNASMDVSEILGDEAFRAAFARFWAFAQRLGLLSDDPPAVPTLNDAFLGALFNYDGIVRKLSEVDEQFFKEYEEQVEAIARIELWLLGYNCAPGPSQRAVRRRYFAGKWIGQLTTRLEIVTGQFWHDVAKQRGHSDDKHVSTAMFVEFRKLLDEPANIEVRDVDQVVLKVNEVLAEEQGNDDDKLSFIGTFETLASSIWDGVKRLAKFIWRVIRGVVSTVTNLVRNLARYIASEAREFFHLVVRAVDAVQGGIDYLRNSIFPKELPAPVVISRSADFDHRMLMNSGAVRIADSSAFRIYRRQAKCYCAGCVILGELVGMLGRVVSLATGQLAGVLGWLRALLALGRFRASIQRVKEALKELDKNYEVSGDRSGALMLIDVA